MQRLPDWEERLVRYLEPLHATPFEWGKHDCCLFPAGAVQAMTGVDPMAEFRDATGRARYSTAIGSARALRKYGAGTIAATIDSKLKRVPVSLAHRGDIIMNAGSLGVQWTMRGQTVAIMVGSEADREGLIRLPRVTWIEPVTWRVPYGG